MARKRIQRKQQVPRTLKTIQRSEKLVQAASLPRILNMNPRSIYNKIKEFKTFVTEREIDLVCMSETWERDVETLDKIIDIEDFTVISSRFQRKGQGGRPAIIVNNKKFCVDNLTQTEVSVPFGVEACLCLLTPAGANNQSIVKKICVISLYSKPDSRKKKMLYDWLYETYHSLSAKHGDGLFWVVCGDVNDLKIEPILHLNGNFKQHVNKPTRLNPDKVLDVIISDLGSYYCTPTVEPALQVDDDKIGSPSDHLLVLWCPLDNFHNKKTREEKKIKFRPLTDGGFQLMQKELEEINWEFLDNMESSDDQASCFHSVLFESFDRCFKLKTKTVTNDSEPYFTDEVRKLQRKKQREFAKHRKSSKYLSLQKLYKAKVSASKRQYYQKSIQNLKNSNPGQWYKQMKLLMKYDQKEDKLEVESLKNLSDDAQAEAIAEKFASIANEFKPLDRESINVPHFTEDQIPVISESEVLNVLQGLKTNVSTRPDDVPAKVLQKFSKLLSKPITKILNNCLKQGIWPDFLKKEIVTPVPKTKHPQNVEELRKISGLLQLNKVFEKIITKMMIADMEEQMDPSQYGNKPGVSIDHYLIRLIDKVLKETDGSSRGESVAAICTMYDWRQAFDRCDATLGIKSYIKNGVRPSLIPIMMSFLENRRMVVKWHGTLSSEKAMVAGGPQGSTAGIIQFLSTSNNCADTIEEDLKFRFIDDLSALELVNLLNIGLQSHNIKQNVPNNVAVHNQIIQNDKLKSQQHVKDIDKWSKENQMKLNPKKCKNMIFNFSRKHQFSTSIQINDEIIETVDSMKILGTYVSNDLKWDKNTDEIVKNSNKRLQILHSSSKFTKNKHHLKDIYNKFVRSKLETSSPVWHSSLNENQKDALERVQRSAFKIILKNKYISYENALEMLNMDTLYDRRETKCMKFAKGCLNDNEMKKMFPLNRNRSKYEKFKVNRARTSRYQKSTIIHMQKLLNKDSERQKSIRRSINAACSREERLQNSSLSL